NISIKEHTMKSEKLTLSVYEHLGIETEKQSHKDLIAVWLATFGTMALSFPFYSYLAFGLAMDRNEIANIFASHVTVAYWLGICAAFLPLPSLRHWTFLRRLQTV